MRTRRCVEAPGVQFLCFARRKASKREAERLLANGVDVTATHAARAGLSAACSVHLCLDCSHGVSAAFSIGVLHCF